MLSTWYIEVKNSMYVLYGGGGNLSLLFTTIFPELTKCLICSKYSINNCSIKK